MIVKRLTLVFACSLFLLSGTAHADVVPVEDTGEPEPDGGDSGCAIAPGGTDGAALAFSALGVALLFRRR